MTTYLPLTEGVFASGVTQRWLAGVEFTPLLCRALVGSPVPLMCTTGDTPLEPNFFLPGQDDADEDDPCVVFEAFQIDTLLEVPTLSSPGQDVSGFMTVHSALARSVILAREAQTGSLTAESPSFVSEAETVTGFDATAVGALAAVEDALAVRLQGGVGMIHITPGMLTILNSGGGLNFDGTSYRTATGHVVVADAGYTNAAPSSGAVVAGRSWIYGSGQVMAKLGEVMVESQFDRRINMETHRVQQYALVMFEPCAVVAAAVDDV
jgi:hypothetical protein